MPSIVVQDEAAATCRARRQTVWPAAAVNQSLHIQSVDQGTHSARVGAALPRYRSPAPSLRCRYVSGRIQGEFPRLPSLCEVSPRSVQNRSYIPIEYPPSTGIAVPVTKSDLGPASNAAIPARLVRT